MRVSLSTGSTAADVWLGTMVVIAFAVWTLVGGELVRLIRNRKGRK